MIVLWTDALIYLLLLLAVAMAYYMHGKEHLKRPWLKITASNRGILSLLVLLLFVSLGFLDSLHYSSTEQGGKQIVSVLDSMTGHLRRHQEKTYSAPFSCYLYSKEQRLNEAGKMQFRYPRLKHACLHLQNPEVEKTSDILYRAGLGLLKGAGLFVFFCALLFSWRRDLHKGIRQNARTRLLLSVLFAISAGVYILIELSQSYHVLGTDKVGEDVLYQSIKSIRTGLVIGTLTTLIMLPMAICFGIFAGYFRGWVDDVIQYIYTTLNSVPSVLLIASAILMVQVYMANHQEQFTSVVVRADMRLFFLCLILGVTSWTGLCRILRAETLKLREMEYVQAAQALGVKPLIILYRHILPNVMHLVLISIALDFSSLVLAEAVLSYINIGVDPTTYSWGNMINGARLEMAREPIVWWSLSAAFVFMFTLVLAANLFADTVRDAFDPRKAMHE